MHEDSLILNPWESRRFKSAGNRFSYIKSALVEHPMPAHAASLGARQHKMDATSIGFAVLAESMITSAAGIIWSSATAA